MKITDLQVGGFGIWRDLSMHELSERVTVVYGENEAGKTTLMHFVRAVLYGFSPDRQQRYLPPVHGGSPGGRLTIALPHGRYHVRRNGNGSPGSVGDVDITSADGSYQSCHQLATLLGGIDEAIFNNVFAVGLREMQQLATLNDTQAAQHLYDLTTGLDRVSLFEVMRELTASRQRILADDERPSQLLQLHAQRQRLEEELRLLHARTSEWVQLAGQVRTANDEIGLLEQRASALERETRLVEVACNVREPWQQRAEMEARLAALGPLAEIPLEDLESALGLADQIAEYRTQVSESKQRRRTLRDEAAAVNLNDKLWRQRARVEALAEQRTWVTSLNDQIARLEDEVLDMDRELAAEQRQVGLAKGRGTATTIPQLSKENLASLRVPLREIREQKQRLDDARREQEQCADEAQRLTEQLDHELGARGVRTLAEAMEHSGQRVSQARRQSQSDSRVDRLLRQRDELQQQSHLYMDRQVLPVRGLVALGVLFTVGMVMVMTAVLHPVFAFASSTAWVLAVMGTAALMLTAAIKFGFEQAAARQLDECRRQEELVQMQIEKVAAETGTDGGRLVAGQQESQAKAAERELAVLEQLVPLESQRDLALQNADAARNRIAQIDEAHRAARNRWRGALRSLGLPQTLSPKEIKAFSNACEILGEKQQKLNDRREELQQRQRELSSLSTRTAQLLLEAGLEPKSPHLIDRIEQLTDELVRQQELAERRDQIIKEARVFRREQARHISAARKLQREQREVLRRAGVSVDRTTKDLPERLRDVRKLRDSRDDLSSRIATSLGVVCEEEELAKHIDGATQSQLEKRLDSLLSQYDGTSDQLKKQYERRGQITEQMNNLAQDRRLAEIRMELACIEKKIDDAVRQWQALGVVNLLLEEIRTLYESERQPETLREASGYLTQLTRGRYTRIWTPLGDNVLKVDDSGGHPLPVEYLSRGTREQVFLSLRLALVAAYARRGVLLPLILDDVLVNFDAKRAELAAKVLREFAKAGNQILIFTCHEHIMQLFRRLNVEIRELPTHGQRANVTPVKLAPPPVVEEELEEEEEYEEEVVAEEEMEEIEEEEEEYEEVAEEEDLELAEDDFEEPEDEFEFSSDEMELPEEDDEEEEQLEVEEEEVVQEEPVEHPVQLDLEEPAEEEEPAEDLANDETEWQELDELDDEPFEYIDDEEAARRIGLGEASEWDEEGAAAIDDKARSKENDGAEAA